MVCGNISPISTDLFSRTPLDNLSSHQRLINGLVALNDDRINAKNKLENGVPRQVCINSYVDQQLAKFSLLRLWLGYEAYHQISILGLILVFPSMYFGALVIERTHSLLEELVHES